MIKIITLLTVVCAIHAQDITDYLKSKDNNLVIKSEEANGVIMHFKEDYLYMGLEEDVNDPKIVETTLKYPSNIFRYEIARSNLGNTYIIGRDVAKQQ